MTAEKILSTRTWEEDHSIFKYKYTEEKLVRDGNNITRTTKTYVGPKAVRERQQWKKFGAALNDNEQNTTTIGADVEFEFTYKPMSHKDEWVPNGLYIGWAKKDNWPDVDIKKIIRSDRPDLVYQDLFRQKMGALFAPLTDTIAKTSASASASSSASSGGSKNRSQPTRKMGLKERMMLKKRDRDSSETPKSENSLSARLNRKKEISMENEHKCTLFVDNVPLEFHEGDIKAQISDFDFKRVSIVKRDGNSIGKAFIEFNSEEDAASCLSDIDGKRWEYNIIAAQFSKPKPKGRR